MDVPPMMIMTILNEIFFLLKNRHFDPKSPKNVNMKNSQYNNEINVTMLEDNIVLVFLIILTICLDSEISPMLLM